MKEPCKITSEQLFFLRLITTYLSPKKKKTYVLCVSVYCQVVLSTTTYLFFFYFVWAHMLSFSLSFFWRFIVLHLSFFLSFLLFTTVWIGLWLPSFIWCWKKKKWNLSHLYTYLIESIRGKKKGIRCFEMLEGN